MPRYVILIAGFILALLGVWGASSGEAEDETMAIDKKSFGSAMRPSVRFTHDKHGELIACSRCHHEYDKYRANKGGEEGRSCSECHTPDGSKNPIPLKRAFHIQCKSCHEGLNSAHGTSLPVMCGQCHMR